VILYIRKIPKFDQNPLQKGIENLFKQNVIDKAELAFPNEFSYLSKGGKKLNFKIDSNKQSICDLICKNTTKEDFQNFETIFNMLNLIINHH